MTDNARDGSRFVRCERCGRENPLGVRFCEDCGNRLTASNPAIEEPHLEPLDSELIFEPAVCRQCGQENADPGRFCVHCGAPFEPMAATLPTLAPLATLPSTAPVGPRNVAPRPAVTVATQRPAQSVRSPYGPAPQGHTSPPAKPRAAQSAHGSDRPGTAQSARPDSHRAEAVLSPQRIDARGAGEFVREPPIQCARCHGVNARHMTFCQFCGARLGSEAPRGRLAGSSAPPGAPQLVVIAQDGTPGRQYPINDREIDIGREEGAILLPTDPYVSPRHARIVEREGRFFVRDLSSVNGVYVRIRAAEQLEHADLVLIGLEVLRFEVVSDAEKGLGPLIDRGTRVFGSPALPRYARLEQRTVEGTARDTYYVGRDETVIGRESGDLVFTNDPFMSRRHAILVRDPATSCFTLRDLESSNGTYLAIRGEQELFQGDHVRIGQHLFRFDVEMGGRTRL